MLLQIIDSKPIDDAGDVLRAAARLIRAFGSHERQSYFSCFSVDATFVFYTHARRLENLAEYESLWHEWETRDKFRILACVSSEQAVTIRGATAIFTHAVTTRVSTSGGTERLAERETIIFEKRDGNWLAVHEHLSPFSAT
jgi:ketosteroid isomerase-like protein